MDDLKVLSLGSDPSDVRLARAWAAHVLTEWGRPELIEAAQVGLSELVTNALLHVGSEVTVRLSGDSTRPRFEVLDASTTPPRPALLLPDADLLPTTVGRGMAIVAAYAEAWGAHAEHPGKVVWFEPIEEPFEDPLRSHFLEFDVRGLESTLPADAITVWLLETPVRAYAQVRRAWQELRREIQLVVNAQRGRYPQVEELAEVARQVDEDRRNANGTAALDAAIVAGVERIDLRYDVSPATIERMERLQQLLATAGTLVAEHGLITSEFTPRLARLLSWYIGEFIRQAHSASPRPWRDPEHSLTASSAV